MSNAPHTLRVHRRAAAKCQCGQSVVTELGRDDLYDNATGKDGTVRVGSCIVRWTEEMAEGLQ